MNFKAFSGKPITHFTKHLENELKEADTEEGLLVVHVQERES
jgi:hypothetical protein